MPPSELTPDRLHDEALTVMGGGLETTMRALTLATYHISADLSIKEKLVAELRETIPSIETRGGEMPSLDALMQLPYLSAVVTETLRLSYGVLQRLPRTSPEEIQYNEWKIPANTAVSMETYSVAHNEIIFPDSYTYRPERWLGNPKAPDGKLLTRYLVAFGRGTRSCVGMQLGYAEIYIGLATLFRRFDFVLTDTDRSDIDAARDRFVPRAKLSSRGVRAFCRKVQE